eukprot:CAMPEP_0184298970 /NCGR_PEP_ID=MMETSP1049-20130417/9682_1 /TAXON_ID=77928 /ORGANISM="Proteomonas sulcata, Strain CCMP704" /LENGTH=159 /DNA_ID=CAMNT_0026609271 /DNA_START=262 /DNA_END=741 /DNA_ORIENTATION=-
MGPSGSRLDSIFSPYTIFLALVSDHWRRFWSNDKPPNLVIPLSTEAVLLTGLELVVRLSTPPAPSGPSAPKPPKPLIAVLEALRHLAPSTPWIPSASALSASCSSRLPSSSVPKVSCRGTEPSKRSTSKDPRARGSGVPGALTEPWGQEKFQECGGFWK